MQYNDLCLEQMEQVAQDILIDLYPDGVSYAMLADPFRYVSHEYVAAQVDGAEFVPDDFPACKRWIIDNAADLIEYVKDGSELYETAQEVAEESFARFELSDFTAGSPFDWDFDPYRGFGVERNALEIIADSCSRISQFVEWIEDHEEFFHNASQYLLWADAAMTRYYYGLSDEAEERFYGYTLATQAKFQRECIDIVNVWHEEYTQTREGVEYYLEDVCHQELQANGGYLWTDGERVYDYDGNEYDRVA